MILKCKMCGGDIELSSDKTFGTCECCGSTMTFPKIDDEQRATMFNRGNQFRRAGDFDKALAVYERIVQEDENDAEAHWCCALCRFGIEYVEDPNTFEYLPTCHRASFDSFLQDVDYLAAVEHSDGITRRQYQKDAARIAEVQRGILATSQNEEPFDVFICYKESENDGSRTRDSLLAQEIYYQLTEQGRRVFFSRITLEDKAGTEYEPYIFAALNSAKVMILVTTSAAHVNAVWVKNEWSRFLALMRKDRKKLLLPCYRDMDPYDLPDNLSALQSYDMSKIGFIQDLIRGVNKVLDADKPKESVKETVVVQQQGNANVAALLKRAFIFLEDGDWKSADDYCEKVLDLDPENGEAYLGKLMSEVQVRNRDALKDCPQPFDGSNNYQKAIRFGSDQLKANLSGDVQFIRDRNELARKTEIFRQASSYKANRQYAQAIELFEQIPGFKDADERLLQCKAEIEAEQNEKAYQRALNFKANRQFTLAIELFKQIPGFKDADEHLKECEIEHSDTLYKKCHEIIDGSVNRSFENWSASIKGFEYLGDYLDAPQLAQYCRDERFKQIVHEIETAEDPSRFSILRSQLNDLEKERNIQEWIDRCNKAEQQVIVNTRKKKIYDSAIVLARTNSIEKLTEAIEMLRQIPDWKDSEEQIVCCQQKIERLKEEAEKARIEKERKAEEERIAIEKAAKKRKRTKVIIILIIIACIVSAIVLFTVIFPSVRYNKAMELYNAGQYEEAIAAFETMNGYKDSEAMIEAANDALLFPEYEAALALIKEGNYEDAINAFTNLGEYRDSKEHIEVCETAIKDREYDAAIALYETGKYEEAIAAFEAMDGYRSSKEIIETCRTAIKDGKYDAACALYEAKKYEEAINTFKDIADYRDSKAKIEACEAAIKANNYDAAIALYNAKKYIKAISAFSELNGYLESKKYLFECWNHIADRKTIAAGSWHTIGLKANGTVVATGGNGFGQCNVSGWNGIIAITAYNNHTVGLKSDGTVVAVGNNSEGECDVSGWKDIVAVATGGSHTVGLKSDGTVVVTSVPAQAAVYTEANQRNVSGWTNIIAIAAGDLHTVGLKSDGTVIATGSNSDGQCNVSDWTNIVAIAAGDFHTIGLKSDGTVVATGYNSDGQCNVSGWKDIVAVAGGGYHTVGLKSDGTVVATGANRYGQCKVSNWKDIVAVAAGDIHTIGLKSDGTVVAVGKNDDGQCDVSGWKSIKVAQ